MAAEVVVPGLSGACNLERERDAHSVKTREEGSEYTSNQLKIPVRTPRHRHQRPTQHSNSAAEMKGQSPPGMETSL
jgi:hypothetical protein